MNHKDYDFTIAVRIWDEHGLFQAAINHRAQDEAENGSFYPDDPVAHYGPDFLKDGKVDIEACLIEILDPGLSPAGLEIQESYATCTYSSSPDEEGEEQNDNDQEYLK